MTPQQVVALTILPPAPPPFALMHVYMVTASRLGTPDVRALSMGSFERENDAIAAVLRLRATASLNSIWHVSYAPVVLGMPYGPLSAHFVMLQAEEWVTRLQRLHAGDGHRQSRER